MSQQRNIARTIAHKRFKERCLIAKNPIIKDIKNILRFWMDQANVKLGADVQNNIYQLSTSHIKQDHYDHLSDIVMHVKIFKDIETPEEYEDQYFAGRLGPIGYNWFREQDLIAARKLLRSNYNLLRYEQLAIEPDHVVINLQPKKVRKFWNKNLRDL